MSILSLLDDRPKTYRILCCMYGQDPWGVYSWGGTYNSPAEALDGVREHYPDAEKAEIRDQLTIGHNFGTVVWTEGWNVVAVYEAETGYVEDFYFVDDYPFERPLLPAAVLDSDTLPTDSSEEEESSPVLYDDPFDTPI